MLDQGRAPLAAFVSGISLGFFGGDERCGIFQKIDPAIVAASTMLLPIAAGRALEREWSMAAQTKFRGLRRLGAALRAFHWQVMARYRLQAALGHVTPFQTMQAVFRHTAYR
jgi:hypothetical protein